jgi:hydrogenase-1 operon protein HyaF
MDRDVSKPFPFPVRVVGPGTQPEDDMELQYLAMPREMNTFRMPIPPENADAQAMTTARDTLAAFLAQMEAWDPASGVPGPRMELSQLPPAALALVNEMLGEGEVAIQVNAPASYRIQESVFTGLWRVLAFDAGFALTSDSIEAAPLPRAVIEAARAGASSTLPAVDMPAGAMNSPALLHEIGAQMRELRAPGAPAHVVNLTLFPMTPDDHAVLERVLPVGTVAIMSRGFGNCRITSTGARDVWRVQYFNQMNTLILNTIEVVAVPEVALAAAEDLEDSRGRLAELVAWMSESCPA